MRALKPQPAVRVEDRMVFSTAVEGLLRHALRGQVSPKLRERLYLLGLDIDRPLLPAYPVAVWEKCLRVIVEETYPGVPPEDAFRQLAERHVDGYGQTLVGRAVFRVMRLLGPRRFMQRMPQMLRSSDNYTEAELEEQGPTTYEMRMNSVLDLPGYSEALFESLLRVSGAESVRAVLTEVEDGSSTYLIRWTER
jgi:uncharacterized protein (TIGR02265 family)